MAAARGADDPRAQEIIAALDEVIEFVREDASHRGKTDEGDGGPIDQFFDALVCQRHVDDWQHGEVRAVVLAFARHAPPPALRHAIAAARKERRWIREYRMECEREHWPEMDRERAGLPPLPPSPDELAEAREQKAKMEALESEHQALKARVDFETALNRIGGELVALDRERYAELVAHAKTELEAATAAARAAGGAS